MSKALEGEHFCEEHQGNHSHYDKKNCSLCKAQQDTQRLKDFREKLCGFIEAGEGDFVTIGQDDATGDWCLSFGISKKRYHDRSFLGVIDKAIADNPLQY